MHTVRPLGKKAGAHVGVITGTWLFAGDPNPVGLSDAIAFIAPLKCQLVDAWVRTDDPASPGSGTFTLKRAAQFQNPTTGTVLLKDDAGINQGGGLLSLTAMGIWQALQLVLLEDEASLIFEQGESLVGDFASSGQDVVNGFACTYLFVPVEDELHKLG